VDLEPIADSPALLMRGRKKWICVADLHIGLEVQLRRAGFNIPTQTPRMREELMRLASFGDSIIILGDLKHRIPSVGYREDKELRPFMKALQDAYREISVIAGNHDGGLTSVLPEGVVAKHGRGIVVEDIGLFHGHVWPSATVMKAERLVMGHIHPSVMLVDSLGGRTNEKCWLRTELVRKKVLEKFDSCPKELVVVPAFNPLLTGTPVNGKPGSMLGPIFRNELADPESYRIYLMDGTNLGKAPPRPEA